LGIISESKKTKYRRYGSIQLRYAMTYVVITFVVLLFLNIYCSEISQMIFYENKRESMLEKAQLTANEIGNLSVLNNETLSQALAKTNDLKVTRLIVTDASGLVIHDTAMPDSGEARYALYPQVVSALRCNDVFSWYYSNGTIQSKSAVPVINYNTVIGCVYMMEYDSNQGQLIHSLQNNIFFITLFLEICVLIFSVIYAARFSGRLQKVMTSMRIIQEGDYTHKVSLGGHDELTFLGEEFNDLTERLQTSESKRRQFVSDASHELKTPLASIKLLTDSILQYDMDMETTKEFVSDIGNEADRLNRMTEKLLSLTKGENDVVQEEREIIRMRPTVERVVKMLRSIAVRNEISIDLDLSDDAPILVTEDDLYQITFNLVENGIKYNLPGGKLTIRLFRQDDMAVLQVTDSGVGIPEDAIGHVFERFYRVDKARSRQTGGSGLGLSIVRSMVLRNNGDISVRSALGQGSTFTVEFPCFDTEVDAE